jgi:hypothetical protein
MEQEPECRQSGIHVIFQPLTNRQPGLLPSLPIGLVAKTRSQWKLERKKRVASPRTDFYANLEHAIRAAADCKNSDTRVP